MVGKIREPEVTHITITGRIIPLDNDSYMELVLLAHRFRKLLNDSCHLIAESIVGIARNTMQ